MKTFGKLAVAFGLVALMAAPAWAQGRGGFGGGGGGMMGPGMLLSNKGVQTELKVSDDQATKLNALAEETRGKMREQMTKLQDVPQDERQEKMQAAMQTVNADVHKSLGDILKPDQVKRFHQIQIQAAGVNAFAQPRVQTALNLTADQKSKIREIGEGLRASTREAISSASDDRQAAMKKVTDLRKDALDKVNALLTDDQKKSYKDLIGDAYEVKFERPNQ